LRQIIIKTGKGTTSGMLGHLRSSHTDIYVLIKTVKESDESFFDDDDEAQSKPDPVLTGK
jgi:hypothetical protein